MAHKEQTNKNTLHSLLELYIKFPEDAEINFNLGVYYHSIGQTASAVSYYLRSAERSEDTLLQYEALIRASMCFNEQGTRNFTVKSILQHAVALCPKRPEAYYLLSRFYEHEKGEGIWNSSYLIASIGEKVADFNSPPLRTNIDYYGKYGLLYRKALACWWCGLCDEARDIFNDLYENYDLDEKHKTDVEFYINKFNETRKNLHSIYNKPKKETEKFDVNILKEFPSVYCTSLEESEDRRHNIKKEFKKYGIEIKPYIFDRFEKYDHKIKGFNIENLDQRTLGPITSHVKMLHNWYIKTDEPYAIFCEDDISLDTVKYWNFTWKEFFEKLPENWECIQMCIISESKKLDVQFKNRQIFDWGCQMYMMKREFVKRIIDLHYDHKNNTFDFTIPNKSFLNPVIEHILFEGKGKVYNFPLFVEDIYKFNSTYLEEENRSNSFNSYHSILNWWKENGKTTTLDKIMNNKTKLIDFCSFYGPYGSEMLLLRYHILKDYVDEFIISESSYSHTGIPVKFECKNKIKEWGLPENKFKVIELETPPDEELVVEYIDELNCVDPSSGNQQTNMKSRWARVRDRLSKDAILQVLDEYDDDTIFIHGDVDEIINPSYLADLINICKNDGNVVIYIPLVYLEGKANLRVYNKTWNCPQAWDWAMFMCKKSVLERATPVQLRSHKLVPEGIYSMDLVNSWNKQRVVDVGWHFSWMGGKESRIIKKESWEHRYDSFDWLITKKYDDSDEFLSIEYKEGDTPPCGNVDLILKNYQKENLPKEIFELPIVEKFLFPGEEKESDEFDWGSFNNDIVCRDYVKNEIEYGVYTKFFDVEKNDIVFDIGASVGPFTNFIINKFPKEVHCFEPNEECFKTLTKNLKRYDNVFLNFCALEKYSTNEIIKNSVYNIDDENKVNIITLKNYIEKNNIKKIDFLKTDCEGGEWFIFTPENYDWIHKNVRKIAGEFHLFDEVMKKSFIAFRDLYLKNAKNVVAFLSNQYAFVEEIDIWNDDYINNRLMYCNISFEYDTSKEFIFSINNNKNTAWIVDNFYEDPDAVREFALKQEYVEGGLGRGFIGNRTEQQFLFPGLKERFEEIMGREITAWQEHGMNGRFQYSWAGQPLVYHCDSQKWGGMLYLTPNAPFSCGTTLCAHKTTRARTYYEEGWDAAWKDVPGDSHLDGSSFEPVDVLGNVYNRLVIFDASAIHSASQYFGTVKENSRLWQMFFFDTL